MNKQTKDYMIFWKLIICKNQNLEAVTNLNSYSLKKFDKPPVKNKGARFRRHPIKEGNLTVTLSNYNIEENNKSIGKWYTSIQYGTGKGFPIQHIDDKFYREIEDLLKRIEGGKKFMAIINNGFSEKITSATKMQEMYEQQKSFGSFTEPTELVDEIELLLNKFKLKNNTLKQEKNEVFHFKEEIPIKQFFALYAINKISTIANSK